jgi:hypothetical protein
MVGADERQRHAAAQVEAMAVDHSLAHRQAARVGEDDAGGGDIGEALVQGPVAAAQVRVEGDAIRRGHIAEVDRVDGDAQPVLRQRVVDGEPEPEWIARLRPQVGRQRHPVGRCTRDPPLLPAHQAV